MKKCLNKILNTSIILKIISSLLNLIFTLVLKFLIYLIIRLIKTIKFLFTENIFAKVDILDLPSYLLLLEHYKLKPLCQKMQKK